MVQGSGLVNLKGGNRKFFFLKGAFDMRLENSLIFTYVFILFRNINKDYSTGTPVSSTSKADHHDINEMLLKVVLSSITK